MGHQLHLAQKRCYLNHSRFDCDGSDEMQSDIAKRLARKLQSNKAGSMGSCGSTNSGESANSLTTESPCSVPASVSRAVHITVSKVRSNLS